MDNLYQIIILATPIAFWMLSIGLALRVIYKRRPVGVSMAWLLIIYVLPFVGVPIYFILAEVNLGKKRAARTKEMYSPYQEWFRQVQRCDAHQPNLIEGQTSFIHDLCRQRISIPPLCGNQLDLYQTTPEILQQILDDIKKAQSHIRMTFYIWQQGGLIDSISAALILARKRGVRVQILADSVGSKVFFKSSWPKQFQDAGIEINQALKVSPMRMFFRRLDLRQHRKIIVIDDKVAYTGSMNMVDPRYFKQDAGVGQWVDVMAKVTGPTASILAAIHAWDWEVETGERHLPNLPVCDIEPNPNMAHPIQVIPSGPGMPENIIQQVLVLSIMQAKESVRITTPYFVPSEELLQTFIMTAQRGVKVELILPAKNDSRLVAYASKSYFEELLKAGVIIYQFKGGLLHTKSVVIDQKDCLIGTVNIDMRSLWLNFELTMAVQDQGFSEKVYALQTQYIQDSSTLNIQAWKDRGVWKKFVERVFYMFNPLL